jgi:hypothetical protein
MTRFAVCFGFLLTSMRLLALDPGCATECFLLKGSTGFSASARLERMDLANGQTSTGWDITPAPASNAVHCLQAMTFLATGYGIPFPRLLAVDAGPACGEGGSAASAVLGTLDWANADARGQVLWEPLPASLGGGRGALGDVVYRRVSGLAWDSSPAGSNLWITVSNDPGPALLAQVDVWSGRAVPDAFGAGLDYVPVGSVTNAQGVVLREVEDLVVSSLTGDIFALLGAPGSTGAVARLDRSTGVVLEHAALRPRDGITPLGQMAGLFFHPITGDLMAVSGAAGPSSNQLFRLSAQIPLTGEVEAVGTIPGTAAVQDGACYVVEPDPLALLQVSVFLDQDQDGLHDANEGPQPGVAATLWVDLDENGRLNPLVDFAVFSGITSTNGVWTDVLVTSQRYVLALETNDFPSGVCGWSTPATLAFGLETTCQAQSMEVVFGVIPCAAMAPVDSDQDGLPDAYEISHGLPPSTPNEDTDLDGLPDVVEYAAGGDPGQALPGDKLFAPRPGGPGIQFAATRSTGPGYEGVMRFFTVRHRERLDQGAWLPLPGFQNIPGLGQEIRLPLEAPSGFYRIDAELR